MLVMSAQPQSLVSISHWKPAAVVYALTTDAHDWLLMTDWQRAPSAVY